MRIFIGEIKDNVVIINKKEELLHLLKVLRVKTNQIIYVTDCLNKMVKCKIYYISNKEIKCNIILDVEIQNNKYFSHLCISPLKNKNRLEFIIEKAVEIGINEITFFNSSNSEKKNINFDRIDKIITSSIKQSIKNYKPIINNEIYKIKDILKLNFPNFSKLILHCNKNIKREKIHNIKFQQNILILIGPEGDFSSDEIYQALNNNFISCELGHQRFRSETAALKSLFYLDILFNR